MVEYGIALMSKLDGINRHSFNNFRLRVGKFTLWRTQALQLQKNGRWERMTRANCWVLQSSSEPNTALSCLWIAECLGVVLSAPSWVGSSNHWSEEHKACCWMSLVENCRCGQRGRYSVANCWVKAVLSVYKCWFLYIKGRKGKALLCSALCPSCFSGFPFCSEWITWHLLSPSIGVYKPVRMPIARNMSQGYVLLGYFF